jgi:thioredoxin 1
MKKLFLLVRLLSVVCLGTVLSVVSHAADTKPSLPRLVDVGASKCIPCKLMKPILEDLTKNYADQFEVVFVDAWEKEAEAAKYSIQIIPTQIFYAADGKELARHEGFIAKKDILAKWKQLGVEVKTPAEPSKK